MGKAKVDRNKEYMMKMWGTDRLITDAYSMPDERGKRVLQEVMHDDLKDGYQIPEDRLSRHCGGARGFDDFVERWHE